jgi:hypothetical protein
VRVSLWRRHGRGDRDVSARAITNPMDLDYGGMLAKMSNLRKTADNQVRVLEVSFCRVQLLLP